MYLNTVFKYNVFKYCPALSLSNIVTPSPALAPRIEWKALLPKTLSQSDSLVNHVSVNTITGNSTPV